MWVAEKVKFLIERSLWGFAMLLTGQNKKIKQSRVYVGVKVACMLVGL